MAWKKSWGSNKKGSGRAKGIRVSGDRKEGCE